MPRSASGGPSARLGRLAHVVAANAQAAPSMDRREHNSVQDRWLFMIHAPLSGGPGCHADTRRDQHNRHCSSSLQIASRRCQFIANFSLLVSIICHLTVAAAENTVKQPDDRRQGVARLFHTERIVRFSRLSACHGACLRGLPKYRELSSASDTIPRRSTCPQDVCELGCDRSVPQRAVSGYHLYGIEEIDAGVALTSVEPPRELATRRASRRMNREKPP